MPERTFTAVVHKEDDLFVAECPEVGTASQVRVASVSDIPRLCGLLSLLFTQEADFHPDEVRQSEGLRQIIENPEAGSILVLSEGTIIIGMVNLLFTVSTALGGRVAILEDMVVDPIYRCNGAGATLLRSAVDVAKESGCLRITLLTDRTNDGAIRFYQRQGFVLSNMIPFRLAMNP
ncbi:MAG: GNAT family N-acetyltransferase [Desulfomonile tiedjei]|uniref:GNAT family N-acetyltransferase n=1 Tax=Desulfomonile tiedjei TaxID=2358 RepID=A0A9D6V2H0_9BACT|nr:GNAT family N-acetyltransferase [Desulfomonile tiedjei]